MKVKTKAALMYWFIRLFPYCLSIFGLIYLTCKWDFFTTTAILSLVWASGMFNYPGRANLLQRLKHKVKDNA